MKTPAQKLSLAEWLTWMEACHPSEIELGLDRVSQVAKNLKVDLSQSTVVTIAGTNGKGSTVSYLESIYRQAGYSVGAYTSPHFIRYNERVRISGVDATDEQLCRAFEKINEARGEIPLTYFEFGTLAALVVFAETVPDLVLLEVGLGGRLDAVNIIDADISVVTTVSIDHVDWLGDDREVIGREKAGIFRSGRYAVCGDLKPPVSVRSFADEIKANLLQAEREFTFRTEENSWTWQGKSASGSDVSIENLAMPTLPLQNASTAIQVAQLIPLEVSNDHLNKGVATASLTGRMQRIEQQGLTYWLDVAHNPESAELLARRVEAMEGSTRLVIGMLSDKDCRQVLETLVPVVSVVYLAGLKVPRGQTAEQLNGSMPQTENSQLFDTVSAAIQQVKEDADQGDNVIIAGSFFTVSEALTALEKE